MDYSNEFKKYAMSDHNLSSMNLQYAQQQIESNMTPYILEEHWAKGEQDKFEDYLKNIGVT